MGRASVRRKRANYEAGATCRGLEIGFGEPSGLINLVEFDKRNAAGCLAAIDDNHGLSGPSSCLSGHGRFLVGQIYHLFSGDNRKKQQEPNLGESHARCIHYPSYS
jgi:hypothetical protein